MKKVIYSIGSLAAFCGLAYYGTNEPTQLFLVDDPNSAEESLYQNYLNRMGKSYTTKEEFLFRFKAFMDTFEMIQQHPENSTSQVGFNFFSDWTKDEIKRMMGDIGGNRNDTICGPFTETQGEVPKNNTKVVLPDSHNWVTKGAVTPVKNQGQCGSCWSFSATGTIEGAYAIASGKLYSFSEQQLVDCAYGKEWMNYGCGGGLSCDAFRYAQEYYLMHENDYAYTGNKTASAHDCKADFSKAAVKVKSLGGMKYTLSDELKTILLKQPVSVSIQADQPIFHAYTGGIITSSACGQQLDHAVLAVGWGTDKGQDYFLVKNSWGTTWGEDGYVRIGASNDNVCGILTRPVYADVWA